MSNSHHTIQEEEGARQIQQELAFVQRRNKLSRLDLATLIALMNSNHPPLQTKKQPYIVPPNNMPTTEGAHTGLAPAAGVIGLDIAQVLNDRLIAAQPAAIPRGRHPYYREHCFPQDPAIHLGSTSDTSLITPTQSEFFHPPAEALLSDTHNNHEAPFYVNLVKEETPSPVMLHADTQRMTESFRF